MGTLDLQPWSVTTPTRAGWEPLGPAGPHKGHLADLSHQAFQKRQSWAWGPRHLLWDGWGPLSSPLLLTLMAQAEEVWLTQAGLKLPEYSQRSPRALGYVTATKEAYRN